MTNYSIKQQRFIEKYFRLGPPSPKGWMNNLTGCPYCRDGSSKNPRSHFLFNPDEIGWQCFNCGKKHKFVGTNLKTLALFVSKSSWKKVGSILLELQKDKVFPKQEKKEQEELTDSIENEEILQLIDYKEIELPDVSIPLKKKASEIAPAYRKRFQNNKRKALEYFEENGLDELYKTKKLYICMEGDYSNRLIFPIYFDGKLISYAARALFPTKNKYLYPPADDDHNDRGRIIYGLDKLLSSTEQLKQIFVVESLTDSWVLNGMAVLSKNITKEQIQILKHFNVSKVLLTFVLDKDEINFRSKDLDLKGIELGKAVLKENIAEWRVSYPKFTKGIKDTAESYSKNGLMKTYDSIMEGIVKHNTNLMLKTKLDNVGKKRKNTKFKKPSIGLREKLNKA